MSSERVSSFILGSIRAERTFPCFKANFGLVVVHSG